MKKKKLKLTRVIPLVILLMAVSFFFIQSILIPTGKVVSETQTASTTAKTTSYVYAGGLAASYDSEGKEKYYINDHLGGTSVVIDKNGNVVASDEYYAFGEEKASTGNEKFTYTGKELDDTELYYYGVRYYDAGIGRFTQPDPLIGGIENPQSLNRYTYTLNNPLKYVDPSGMKEKPVAVLIYTSQTPEFQQEVNQYMSNYKDRFDFQVFGVYGEAGVRYAIEETNALIDKGREVTRVNFFDHHGGIMFGMDDAEWSNLPRIKEQEGVERKTLMGTCSGGGSDCVFQEMVGVAGSKSYVGVDYSFYGVTRYPVKNDLLGLLTSEPDLEYVEGVTINQIEKLGLFEFNRQDFERYIKTSWGIEYASSDFRTRYSISKGSENGRYNYRRETEKIVQAKGDQINEVPNPHK